MKGMKVVAVACLTEHACLNLFDLALLVLSGWLTIDDC